MVLKVKLGKRLRKIASILLLKLPISLFSLMDRERARKFLVESSKMTPFLSLSPLMLAVLPTLELAVFYLPFRCF